jgi:hypothetical protein
MAGEVEDYDVIVSARRAVYETTECFADSFARGLGADQ